ncbi:MAG: SulP family inorganic anion transporter [Chloroflexota bacterium]|jgi:SulP family sulfate permease
MFADMRLRLDLRQSLSPIPYYLFRPARLFREYSKQNLRPDLVAGLTVAVILLPQSIAFALLAELPAQMGIYTALVAAVVGGLWGSSQQTHTGPANAISLLVLSILLTGFTPGTNEFVLAAGMLAVMAGIFQLVMGLARLGILVNFVSHSVIVGFASGAGVLIAVRQLPQLLGVQVEAEGSIQLGYQTILALPQIILPAAAIGIGTILLLVILARINKRIPAALIALVISSLLVFALSLDEQGVTVIGKLPQSLPPIAKLPLLDVGFITKLSTGALAVGAIGLVQTTAIARSIATQTGQRLDSNQEFVGLGLANILGGFFSGFPSVGSFSRSAVNLNAGAKTGVASILSAVFVLLAMFLTAPMAAYLPRAALAGVLIVVAIGMIDTAELKRIWIGTRGDALIMLATFLGTLFIEISYAVLLGIMLSFVRYILRTSTPRVHQVVPDKEHHHFTYRPTQPHCPQLGVIDILGDLYFGAVNHVEEVIHHYQELHPEQRYLLIRMHNVNNCDFSGIHMLESVLKSYRDNGGDVFMVRVGYQVEKMMLSTGFYDTIGVRNILDEDDAISHIFYHVLDPTICIYECPYRVFTECENLPKQVFPEDIKVFDASAVETEVEQIAPEELWESIRTMPEKLTVIDVREPREYRRGHVPGAQLVPLTQILTGEYRLACGEEHQIVFICRSGRRSRRAAQQVLDSHANVKILKGGMLGWEASGLLEAVDYIEPAVTPGG